MARGARSSYSGVVRDIDDPFKVIRRFPMQQDSSYPIDPIDREAEERRKDQRLAMRMASVVLPDVEKEVARQRFVMTLFEQGMTIAMMVTAVNLSKEFDWVNGQYSERLLMEDLMCEATRMHGGVNPLRTDSSRLATNLKLAIVQRFQLGQVAAGDAKVQAVWLQIEQQRNKLDGLGVSGQARIDRELDRFLDVAENTLPPEMMDALLSALLELGHTRCTSIDVVPIDENGVQLKAQAALGQAVNLEDLATKQSPGFAQNLAGGDDGTGDGDGDGDGDDGGSPSSGWKVWERQ